MKVSWEAVDLDDEQAEPFVVPDAPAPPAPYVLTGFEDEIDDFLTSDCLQRVTLQKPPAQAPVEKELDALSQLELAVRRRAGKKMDAALMEEARACAKRVDDIRFEKTLLAQAQVVQEAKRVEQLLDQQGGSEALRAANWPSFDVAALDAMLKRDLEVHNTIVAAKRALAEQRADQVEQLLTQLQQVQQSLDYLRSTNGERFQLRLRVEAQQEAKTKYAILLLQLLFESGFRSDEQQRASRSKFGAQFQSQKAHSFLKVAVQMSKKLNALIKGASENEKLLIEQMLKRALELLEGKPQLSRSSSGSALVLVRPEQVPELSEEEANALMATATGKVREQDKDLFVGPTVPGRCWRRCCSGRTCAWRRWRAAPAPRRCTRWPRSRACCRCCRRATRRRLWRCGPATRRTRRCTRCASGRSCFAATRGWPRPWPAS